MARKKPASAQIIEAAQLIATFGPYDGAHHKDWVLQQALKILMGWNEKQLMAMLKRMEWEPGTPP